MSQPQDNDVLDRMVQDEVSRVRMDAMFARPSVGLPRSSREGGALAGRGKAWARNAFLAGMNALETSASHLLRRLWPYFPALERLAPDGRVLRRGSSG